MVRQLWHLSIRSSVRAPLIPSTIDNYSVATNQQGSSVLTQCKERYIDCYFGLTPFGLSPSMYPAHQRRRVFPIESKLRHGRC